MDAKNTIKYKEIRDENGHAHLCPYMENLPDSAAHHLQTDDCLEKEVAERYAGNIDFTEGDG